MLVVYFYKCLGNVIDNDFKNKNFKEYPDIFIRMKKS